MGSNAPIVVRPWAARPSRPGCSRRSCRPRRRRRITVARRGPERRSTRPAAAADRHAGRGRGGKKPRPAVNARSTPPREHSLVKTLPVTRRPGARPVAVTSLPLSRVGRLRRGTGLEIAAELQVTVCLRPGQARRRRGDCVGRVYGYDPRIRVQLALAEGRRTAEGSPARPAADAYVQAAAAEPQPSLHGHGSLAAHRLGSGERGMPACAPRSCRLNLIASASDPHAAPHQRVVIGGIDKRGRIDNQGEARISAIRYRRGGFVSGRRRRLGRGPACAASASTSRASGAPGPATTITRPGPERALRRSGRASRST